jgi:hypothetical protein
VPAPALSPFPYAANRWLEPRSHARNQFLACHNRTVLQIVNCRKRSSTCLRRRSCCAILSNEDVIVVLVRIYGCVVHAHISNEAADEERVYPEPPQEKIEICGKEAAVATFWDDEIAFPWFRLRTEVDSIGPFDAVNSLVAIEFPPEINALLSMSFLREDHGHAYVVSSIDQRRGPRESLG